MTCQHPPMWWWHKEVINKCPLQILLVPQQVPFQKAPRARATKNPKKIPRSCTCSLIHHVKSGVDSNCLTPFQKCCPSCMKNPTINEGIHSKHLELEAYLLSSWWLSPSVSHNHKPLPISNHVYYTLVAQWLLTIRSKIHDSLELVQFPIDKSSAN